MIFSEQFCIYTHDGMEVLYNYAVLKMDASTTKSLPKKGSEACISLVVGLSGFCVCRGGCLWKLRVESHFSLAQTKYRTHPIQLHVACKIPVGEQVFTAQRLYRLLTGRTGLCSCRSEERRVGKERRL